MLRRAAKSVAQQRGTPSTSLPSNRLKINDCRYFLIRDEWESTHNSSCHVRRQLRIVVYEANVTRVGTHSPLLLAPGFAYFPDCIGFCFLPASMSFHRASLSMCHPFLIYAYDVWICNEIPLERRSVIWSLFWGVITVTRHNITTNHPRKQNKSCALHDHRPRRGFLQVSQCAQTLLLRSYWYAALGAFHLSKCCSVH